MIRVMQCCTGLAEIVYDELLRPEMQKGLIAQKTLAVITEEIRSGKAFIAMDRGSPIGYISIREWSNGIEIMSLVVDKYFRKRRIGTELIQLALKTVKRVRPGQKIMALTNVNSDNIFRRLGFQSFVKLGLPEEMRRACVGCPEDGQFPHCHCETMVLPQKDQFYVCQLNFADRKVVDELAKFYCETWKEPPWNEYFWEIEKVIADIAVNKHNDIWLIAKIFGWIVGFAAGRMATQEDVAPLVAGSVKLPHPVAFMTEIGVRPGVRLYGIGSELNRLLGKALVERGARSLIGRTKAIGAIKILARAGFEKTHVSMPGDPERFYWLLKT